MLFTILGQSVLEKIVPCVLSTALGLCKIKSLSLRAIKARTC